MKKILSAVLALTMIASTTILVSAALEAASAIETASNAGIEFTGMWDEGVVDPGGEDVFPPGIPTPSPGTGIPPGPPPEPSPIVPPWTGPGEGGLDPEEPPPSLMSNLGIEFWEHDIPHVLAEAARAGSVNFHSVRTRNTEWDGERDNGNMSLSGAWVQAKGGHWRVTVNLGNFHILDASGGAPTDVTTLAGSRMLLNPFGPAVVGIPSSEGMPTFSNPILTAGDVASVPIVRGRGMFAGGRNFEGRLNALNGTITQGAAQAQLLWTFGPDLNRLP